MDEKKQMYTFIEQYAEEKQLKDTLKSLSMLQEHMGERTAVAYMNINGTTRYRGHYQHALSVCKLLISLVLPLTQEEEDIVLAAALCHVIPNVIDYEVVYEEILEQYAMDPRICEIISLIINDTDLSQDGQDKFYRRIKENRLALIVFLSDRANLVQELYNMSIWSANEYIFETRTYLFPLCIYAKEAYPEIMPMVSILMEKIRTLIDACAILLKRYETREMELTEDILNYQEENSRIRGIIKELKKQKDESSDE